MSASHWQCRHASRALFALLLAAAPVGAQDPTYTISGRVRDAATSEPLPGAQVYIDGTRFSAVTTETGTFTVLAPVAPGNYTLRAQLIGRAAASVPITLGAERTITVPDIMLRAVALTLDEIVVTGTAAPTSRRALGNAVSTVDGEEITASPATTIDQALQGKISGALITSNTGTPGGGVSIRLRGTSSIVGGAEPLIIVDGVIIDNNGDQQINFGYRSNPSNRLADLDPNDIERVEVLKGAAAAALFGSRANNGVVQIFTKRGKTGAPQIVASTRVTQSELADRIDFALTPVDLDGSTVRRFDHQDLIFRDSWSNDSYLSVSGGSGDTRYYMSGNWVNENGIMEGADHNKLNVRLNLDQRIGSWFDIAAGANYVRSHTDLVINGEQGFGGLLTAIVFTPTTVDLSARDPVTGELVNRLAGPFPNPLDVLANWETPQDLRRFVGSLQLRANPFGPLTLEHRFGYDQYDLETRLAIPRGDPNAALGSVTSTNRGSLLVNNDLVGTFAYGLGSTTRMNSSVGMNHTYQRVNQFNLGASDLTPLTTLVRGAVQTASEAEIEAITLGFFGQQQVAWQDRVYLTGALRWDASSTFGDEERWQLYPKVSASWVIGDEPFFDNSAVGDFFSELRLRAALGYAGNQPPLSSAYARAPRFTQTVNVTRLGLIPLSSVGNPNLKPERQREWELGFDAGILDGRVSTAFTYYDKFTDDLLLVRPFLPSAGFDNILDNVGALSNKGIELELNTINFNRARWGWNSRLILSRNTNEVDRLTIPAFTLGYTNRVQEGEPLGVHFMSAFLRDSITGAIVTDSLGPVRAPTSQITGNPWPDLTASLFNEFRLANDWTASFLLDGQFGHELWNQTQRIMDIFGAGPAFDRVLRGEISAAQRTRRQSIFESYLEDASFVKLRDVTIRYSTDAGWVSMLGAGRAQIEFVARNLYTWTDYTGYDPEINMFGLSTVERGTDFAVYPNPRTFGFGVRLSY